MKAELLKAQLSAPPRSGLGPGRAIMVFAIGINFIDQGLAALDARRSGDDAAPAVAARAAVR